MIYNLIKTNSLNPQELNQIKETFSHVLQRDPGPRLQYRSG